MKTKFYTTVRPMALTVVCLVLCAQLALAQPDRIYGPLDPPPLGIMTTYTGSGPNDGQVGMAGGKTCTYQNCDLSANTTVYFSILNNEVKASMDGCSYTGSEVMTYQAGQSSLNGGVAVWTGYTYIPLWNGSTYISYGREIRFIMTVTDGSGTPVPLISAASLGLPSNCGAVAPITDPNQVLKVRMEIQTYYSSWQPILSYYNAEAQHTPSGNQVCTNIDWGFYWVNSPPQLTVKMPLALSEGSMATITSTHLQAFDVESGPNEVYLVPEPNHAPVVTNPVADQQTDEDALFEFTIPGNTFTDEDPGDVLTWMATLSDDSSLPAWLTFDPETLLFSGTPENGDVGTIEIKVTVTDRGEASASDLFLLTVNNTNDPPILFMEIADVNAEAKVSFSYIFPEGTFVDDDPGDNITYSAEALTFGGGLPTWLSFDGLMRKFTGTPAPEDVGTYNIVVTATDNSLSTTTDTFDIVVSPHSGIIDEAGGLNLRIYPNPSEGVFHVDMQLSEMQDIELRVLTLTGQLIWHQKHAGQVGEMRYTVDVKGKGFYNLEIIHNKGIITKRIVLY